MTDQQEKKACAINYININLVGGLKLIVEVSLMLDIQWLKCDAVAHEQTSMLLGPG